MNTKKFVNAGWAWMLASMCQTAERGTSRTRVRPFPRLGSPTAIALRRPCMLPRAYVSQAFAISTDLRPECCDGANVCSL